MHERRRPPSRARATSFESLRSPSGSTSKNWRIVLSWATIALVLLVVVQHLWQRRHAQPFPETGSALWYVPESPPRIARLTLSAPRAPDQHFAVRLDDWATGAPVVLIPVRSGETAVTLMPLGRYRMTISKGTTWQGSARLFGSSGSDREVAHPVEFFSQGNVIHGHRFELEVPFVGNVETRPRLLR
jgi:hypothetical protein